MIESGTYDLSGGSLSASEEIVGYSGDCSFTQSNGTHTVQNTLTVGFQSFGSPATYTLTGGTLKATTANIGLQGSGAVVQTGGSHTVTSQLHLGRTSGIGNYELSGGTLFVQDEFIGLQGEGRFLQNGGVHTAGSLAIGANLSGQGSYSISTGTLTAGRVDLNQGGEFSQWGGTVNAAIFNQYGGLVLGDLENRGAFNYYAGTFYARLHNYGSVSFKTDFVAWYGLANYAAAPLAIDKTVTFVNGGLDNQGIIILNRGALISYGTVLNNTTGTLSGAGSIAGSFINRGTLKPGLSVGTISVAGSYTQTSSGKLQMEIASAAEFDRLRVSGSPGTASLAGTISPVFLPGYHARPERRPFPDHHHRRPHRKIPSSR